MTTLLGTAIVIATNGQDGKDNTLPPPSDDSHLEESIHTVGAASQKDKKKPSWWTGVVREVGHRDTSMQNSCINNLRQIQAGKEQLALEQAKATGDPVNWQEVNEYIKGGPPECPAGGTYGYNSIGTDATCDVIDVGHGLP